MPVLTPEQIDRLMEVPDDDLMEVLDAINAFCDRGLARLDAITLELMEIRAEINEHIAEGDES